MPITMNEEKSNSIWIAVRINDSFLYINDVPYDIFILMNGMDAHVFGHVIAKASDGAPMQTDVDALFQKAWTYENRWPDALVIPENNSAAPVFKKSAEKNGLSIDAIPLTSLSPVIAPLVEKFADDYKNL
jgi:hypothetical protein